jgi:drug/metabolite transporter (DMT)-like permease
VQSSDTPDASAKLMLVVLSFVWGTTWPAMRIALLEIPPFSMRVVSLGLGAAALLVVVRLQGRSFALERWRDWGHVIVGGILNIIGFTMLSAFALLLAATSRVTILAYTMPIWAALFAWLVLGERFSKAKVIALLLCCAGMVVLIYPLASSGIPLGLVLAVGTGVAWAAGTVYLKWAQIHGDVAAVAAWQLTVAFVIVCICTPFVEGGLHVTQAHLPAWLGMIYTGVVGSAFAYFLWFSIVGKLPAMTASLGLLSVPLIGVISTAIVLGERPTAFDMMGFVLIFAASVCVMLPSRS